MTARYIVAAALLFTSSCVVGPHYNKPTAPAPPAFKEQPPEGWKQSQPSDAMSKGKWWEMYNDPELNALEQQVSISNQNVLQAEAQYRQATAGVRVARSGLFPVVSTDLSVTGARSGGGSNSNFTTNGSSTTRASFNLGAGASWEPDLWGSIRRGVTGAKATAQSFAAELENARLLFQAELARDYFQMRATETQMDLLRRTEASYQEYLDLTRSRFKGGVASDLDVAQAESQLSSVQAQLLDLGVQRAQFEHAIAILVGKAPSEITIAPANLQVQPPSIPVGVPSELLERRPDVAGAERRVAASNEQIGIAMSAFYPNLLLSGSAGAGGSTLGRLFSLPGLFWSVGPQLAQTLFDAGRRRAVVEQQRAAYDANVAAYRETVLTALQQVEDNLAALRILQEEEKKVQETIQAANRQLKVSTAQYRAGTASYLVVITSQTTLLGAEQTAVSLLMRRLTASVLLIEALGGGWDTSTLPSP